MHLKSQKFISFLTTLHCEESNQIDFYCVKSTFKFSIAYRLMISFIIINATILLNVNPFKENQCKDLEMVLCRQTGAVGLVRNIQAVH